jgi:acetate kinase
MLGAGAAHQEALDHIVHHILSQDPTLAAQLVAIGHRIVHGGERFSSSVQINDDVIAGIEAAIPFAPLHNPAHLIGIRAALKVFPQLADKNVAVFDTAFHQSLPEEAYLYALPYKLYKENGIRRYGAHGTSHRFIAEQAAIALGKPLADVNVINCHLGNGASVCAIKNGKSVDTSMGLTPLEGLAMGTRSGDLDPAIIFFLHDKLGYSVDEINTLLTKQSGLLGLTEASSDCRYATSNYGSDAGAKRAVDVFTYRVAKYVGAYAAAMDGRLDAVVFTGGIGENAAMIREMILDRLALLGFKVDKQANEAAVLGGEGRITTEDSRPALVIPTNEEWVIARDAIALVG